MVATKPPRYHRAITEPGMTTAAWPGSGHSDGPSGQAPRPPTPDGDPEMQYLTRRRPVDRRTPARSCGPLRKKRGPRSPRTRCGPSREPGTLKLSPATTPFTAMASGRPAYASVVTPWIAANCVFGVAWSTARYRNGLSSVAVDRFRRAGSGRRRVPSRSSSTPDCGRRGGRRTRSVARRGRHAPGARSRRHASDEAMFAGTRIG